MKTPAIASRYINTIPVLLSVSLISAVVYFYGLTQYFSPLILGIIAGGLVDLDNGLKGKVKNLFFTLIAFAVSSLAVQLTYQSPIALTIALTALAFVFTFLGAVGTRFRTISFGTLVVAVYTTLSHNAHAPLYMNSLLILCGTVVYSGAALLVHIFFPHRPVQDNMANAFEQLAHYLEAKADLFDPDETANFDAQHVRLAMANAQVNAAFNQTRATLFYRMRGQHRHPRTVRMLQYYFVAQDIHERSSSSHVHYQAFAEQMKFSDVIFRIHRLMRLQADAARMFARCLRKNEIFQLDGRLERANQGAYASLQYYAGHLQQNSIQPYRIQRLLDNIIHISHQFTHLTKETDWHLDETPSDKTRLSSPDNSGFKGVWRSLKIHFTRQSATFRHAVRMSLIVWVCCVLVQFISVLQWDNKDLNLGFWILLTAVFVCQPNYSATKKRLVQRIIGTFAGVLIGSALPIFALTLLQKLIIAAVATVLFFYFRTNKHSFSTGFITIEALMGFSIMGFDVATFFLPRISDTLIGAAVAGFAVYFLWPDWRFVSLDKTAAQAIRSDAGYLKAVLHELQHGISDDIRYRVARRASHDKAAALSSVLSDMSGEPEKHGTRLQNGFSLLKINYSLISYISALGAYRDTMHNDESEFVVHFYHVAEQTAQLLSRLPDLGEEDFQAAYRVLQNELGSLREELEREQESEDPLQNPTLWQQLSMINELLPQCFVALNGEAQGEWKHVQHVAAAG